MERLVFVGIVIALFLFVLVFLIVRSRKKRQDILDGELIYDIGRSLLKRSIVFEPVEEMKMSIGPEPMSDNHIAVNEEFSFVFFVKAKTSSSGDRLINVRCEPPGFLKHDGRIKSEVDLYNGDDIEMNGIPLQYFNGSDYVYGENILKGRSDDGEIS